MTGVRNSNQVNGKDQQTQLITASDFVAAKSDQTLKPAVSLHNVSFSYLSSSQYEAKVNAVENISLDIRKGQHISILGRNGSGKSTLAKLINGLLLPDEGEVLVFEKNTSDENQIWDIRQNCGMVFQNPDNQIVGTTVEEDVAFGPENLGIPSAEIRRRVDDALATVGLSDYARKAPTQLSGGQKQKLAIAGILAMQPQCIILDEATSMLDPKAGYELMSLIKELQEQYGLTIIDITHDIEKAVSADYIYVMRKGKIFFEGTPRQVFQDISGIRKAGLTLPQHLLIFHEFLDRLPTAAGKRLVEFFPQGIFSKAETVVAIHELFEEALGLQTAIEEKPENRYKKEAQPVRADSQQETATIPKEKEFPFRVKTPAPVDLSNSASPPIITFSDLSFAYQRGTDFEKKALQDINFSIKQGELVSIIGHSGSGKSTLISHINGLIRPQEGQVRVFDYDTSEKSELREIRKHVGLLFQYPEHQLFENTVHDDIAFGPKQFGMTEDQIQANIEKAIKIVGIDRKILTRSPFELSGGQQRRVAIAGIIAMDCDVYVLDEPAAGLDPVGQDEIFHYIEELKKLGKTIILVTHDMNLAAAISDRVLVLQDGRIVAFDSVEQVFSNQNLLSGAGLRVPSAYQFSKELEEKLKLNVVGFAVGEVVDKLITGVLIKSGNGKSGDQDE